MPDQQTWTVREARRYDKIVDALLNVPVSVLLQLTLVNSLLTVLPGGCGEVGEVESARWQAGSSHDRLVDLAAVAFLDDAVAERLAKDLDEIRSVHGFIAGRRWVAFPEDPA